MMGETFKYAAPVLGSLGYSAEDSAIAIGLMANAGIKSSQLVQHCVLPLPIWQSQQTRWHLPWNSTAFL